MIRIAHCIAGLDTGGAEMMLYRMLRRADVRRFEHHVISLTGRGPIEGRLTGLGVQVRTLGMSRGIPDPAGIWRLHRFLRRLRPDLLQTYMYHANLYGLAAGRLAGIPVVWGIRCTRMDASMLGALTAVAYRLNRRLSAGPCSIVVNSYEGHRSHASDGFNAERMVVIPNGLDLQDYAPDPARRREVRAELGVPEESALIGRFGRFHPVKGYRTLLAAAGLVLRRSPAVYFLLAGSGTEASNPQLARWAREAGCDGRVRYLGYRSDVPRLMASLDVAVSSSLAEGFPNVVAEAMACGVPCVVTDVGDSARVVGDTGKVVPPENPEALADGILELIESGPERRESLGRAARRRIEEYDIGKCVERMQNHYVELLRRNSPGAGNHK